MSAGSFLVINTFGIGDVLFTLPLLKNLRQNFSGARIYYLCNGKAASLVKGFEHVDEVFVYERDEFVAALQESFFKGMSRYREFIRRLRRERIDCALDLSLNAPFGFFAWAAGIKQRYGLDYKGRSRFLNRRIHIDGFLDRHVADYYLDVLRLLDVPVVRYPLELAVSQELKAQADSLLNREGLTGKTLIGVLPGGGSSWGSDALLKHWPPERFAQAADRLIDAEKAAVVLFGEEKEREVLQRVKKAMRFQATDLCGKTSLPMLAALLQKMDLVLANDGGPFHIAEAVGARAVAVFGPVPEKIYGPYLAPGERIRVVSRELDCRPCYYKFRLKPCDRDRECLGSITVDEVVDAALSLLKSRGS